MAFMRKMENLTLMMAMVNKSKAIERTTKYKRRKGRNK